MILVDRALEARAAAGKPVRVALVGAGFMGRGIANQILRRTPGMELVAIANRSLEPAALAYTQCGLAAPHIVESRSALQRALEAGEPVITQDPSLVCGAPEIDAIIEATGSIDFGARVVLHAIKHGKHVVLMNAELEATLGPILRVRADGAGVVLTACDGDQPGVQMNLHRFVSGIGLRPLVCGNIKGLQDPYRTPETQAAFARRWGQRAPMVTSFADGTKISFEQATVANATGMRVAKRGMTGHEVHGRHVDELTSLYDVAELERLGGIVDYVVGAHPAPGVFVFASEDDPSQRRFLELYKLGKGGLYSFYTPQHLCHFEVPTSVARAVLFQDAVLTPRGAPVVEVVATAKTNLSAGRILDGIGHFMTYGQCENADVVEEQRILPMGIAEGCRLRRDVRRDEVLSYDDVEVPAGRLVDRLREEQRHLLVGATMPPARLANPNPISPSTCHDAI